MPDRLLRQILLLIEPLGILWICLIVLAAVLLRRKRFRTAAAVLSLVAFIYILGATDFPQVLLGSLERPYAGADVRNLPPGDAVVMLGGGIDPARYEAAGFHLTRAGDRLLMAVRLMQLGKAPVLVLGGGSADLDGQPQIESELVRNWIRDWRLLESSGQAEPEILALAKCNDTHDEALRTQALAQVRGWKRVLLVTSAAHMSRAVATFRQAGVPVEPVPCNFMTTVSIAKPPGGFSVPRYEGLEKISVWLHEQIGWLEYRRRGWVAAAR